MNEFHKKIFSELVKAYYNDNFESKVAELLNKENIDKKEVGRIISILCGVNVPYDEYFIDNLKRAISLYEINHNIIEKISDCSMSCNDTGGETHCQQSCPFDAIIIDPVTHQSYIDPEKCVECGVCVEACENGHIMDRIQFIPFAQLLKSQKPLVAAVAPAIMGQFGEDLDIDQLRAAFKKIGFIDMVEVAFFADMLTLKEAVEFDEHVKSEHDLMITSCCCPIWVAMLRKVYKDLVKHVSPSVSPMVASARVIKALNPHCKVVFIGPCIAKKAEAKEKDLVDDVDYVLTFDEVQNIFDALEVIPSQLEPVSSIEYASKGGRLYGRTGGVSEAIGDAIRELFPEKYRLLKAIQGNGVKDCKEILEKAQNGDIAANFLEGMGCNGGCVGGPKVLISKERGAEALNTFGKNSEIKVATHSDRMKDVLKRLNIHSIDDFRDKETINIFERFF